MKPIPYLFFGLLLMSTALITPADTVLYHRFDGDTGVANGATATTISDSSGSPLHPGNSIIGSPQYSSDVFGTPVLQTGSSNGFSLDLERSASQHYSVADSDSLDFGAGSAFSIEAWVKLETVATIEGNTRQMLVLKKSGANTDNALNYGFMVQRGSNGGTGAPNQLGLLLGNGSSWSGYYSSLTITDTTSWHYVAVRFDDATDTAIFNLDGASQTMAGTVTQSIAANALDLTIGAHMSGTGAIDYSFDGKIDELRISNTFLSDTELLNAIPEPSSLVLVGVAVAGLVAFRRRR